MSDRKRPEDDLAAALERTVERAVQRLAADATGAVCERGLALAREQIERAIHGLQNDELGDAIEALVLARRAILAMQATLAGGVLGGAGGPLQ